MISLSYFKWSISGNCLSDYFDVSKSILVDCFYSGSFALMLARSGMGFSKLNPHTDGDRTPSYKSSQPKIDISYLNTIILVTNYSDGSLSVKLP